MSFELLKKPRKMSENIIAVQVLFFYWTVSLFFIYTIQRKKVTNRMKKC
jgi:hypothetical protein